MANKILQKIDWKYCKNFDPNILRTLKEIFGSEPGVAAGCPAGKIFSTQAENSYVAPIQTGIDFIL